MKTKLLKNCDNNIEAEMLKGLLANEGIECILGNETMSGYPPMNGVDVFVKVSDYEKALAIVKANEYAEETKKAEEEARTSAVQSLLTHAIFYAVGFPVLQFIFRTISGSGYNWLEGMVQGVFFSLFMTAFHYYDLRKKNKKK